MDILLFKQDLESYPTVSLEKMRVWLGLPAAKRSDLVWLIAIHQAQNNTRVTMPSGEESERLLEWAREKRIESEIKAVLDGSENLDLSSAFVRSRGRFILPPEIGKLDHLTYLNISNNDLTDLPPEIGQLYNLTYLDISENRIKKLPLELSNLSKLNTFNVKRNPLMAGEPKTIKELLAAKEEVTTDIPSEKPKNIGNYTIIKQIGSKSVYGEIMLVEANKDFTTGDTHITKGDKFAIKVFREHEDHGLADDVVREIDILNRIKFPYTLGAIETFSLVDEEECKGVNVVLPLAIGDLSKYILQQKDIIPRDELIAPLQMFQELLMGLLELHSNYIIHNDIKPDNILLFDRAGKTEPTQWEEPIEVSGFDLQPKIADFGLSTVVNGIPSVSSHSVSQSLWWRPPELFDYEQNDHSFESDVWAMGIVFYELATGKRPFNTFNEFNMLGQIKKFLASDWRSDPRLSSTIGKEMADLISKMLDPNPDTRINSKNALKHPVFSSLDFDKTIFTPLVMPTMDQSVDSRMSDKIRKVYIQRLRNWVANVTTEYTMEITNAITFLAIDIFDRTVGVCSNAIKDIMFVAILISSKIYAADSDKLLERIHKQRLAALSLLECKMMECMGWAPFRPTLQMLFPDVDADVLLMCYSERQLPGDVKQCVDSTDENIKKYITRIGREIMVDISDKALAPFHAKHGDRFTTSSVGSGMIIGVNDGMLRVLMDRDNGLSHWNGVTDYKKMIQKLSLCGANTES